MVQKGLKEVGYSYVNVDDGFFGWRDERGVMQTHPERFPNGLKGVADHIHSLGLKAAFIRMREAILVVLSGIKI